MSVDSAFHRLPFVRTNPQLMISDTGYDCFCPVCLIRFGGSSSLIGKERDLEPSRCGKCLHRKSSAALRSMGIHSAKQRRIYRENYEKSRP